MREFKIAEPRTADEAAALLAETKETAVLIAGGTDLIDELKSGVSTAGLVVDLRGIPGLAGITPELGGLRIGAMTRIVDLAGNAAVARDYPVLKQAALSLATPQLRNVGTVGATSVSGRGAGTIAIRRSFAGRRADSTASPIRDGTNTTVSSGATGASSSIRRTWRRLF